MHTGGKETEFKGCFFFPLALPDLELNLVYLRCPLRTKCNSVNEKGCRSGPRLEGLVSEHHEDNDRLRVLQKAHGLCVKSLQLPRLVLPTQHVGPTALIWTQETGRAPVASRAACTTAYLQSKHLRIFPTLCSLGCKPDFLVYHQLLSFPQQKSAHAGKTSTSVSPTLFQGHPLLQINLSVSEVTNNFNTWLV